MTEELLTYRDTYEHLLDVFGLTGKDQNQTIRMLRRAITEAYRRLPGLNNWAYYLRTTMVQTDATYATGTIAYSTSTNQVTLSSGTWPTNAVYGVLIISEVQYKIARRISDTVIELDSVSKPASTVAAGTSYRWARFRYLLPIDVGDIREVINSQYLHSLMRLPAEDIFWRTQVLNTETYPSAWSMIRSEDYPGRWELWFSSADASARELRILYEAQMTSLPIEEITTGTVTTVGDVVTFSSAVLTTDCVGCVLRVSTDTNKPTPKVGSWIDSDTGHVTRLPSDERVITQYTTTTTAVLNRALTSDVSGKAYSLSSHVDVNPSTMWELFMRICEQQYNIITRANEKDQMQSRGNMQEALRAAAIADSRRIEGVQRRTGFEPTVSNDSVS
tara:strand:- start:560 stop:1726 length:1167 start_codon:yes stop_codon:yes gene_type:complete